MRRALLIPILLVLAAAVPGAQSRPVPQQQRQFDIENELERLPAYGVFDLRKLRGCDWRLSPDNVWAVERALIRLPHRQLRTSARRYRQALARCVENPAAHAAAASRPI